MHSIKTQQSAPLVLSTGMWRKLANVVTLVAMTGFLHVNVYAQQSATLSVQANFNVPVTITCGTSVNMGTFNILSTAELSMNSTVIINPETWSGPSDLEGNAAGSFAAGTDVAIGNCTLQGVSGSDFALSVQPIDLEAGDGTTDTLEFLPMITGTDGTKLSLFNDNYSVPVAFDTSADPTTLQGSLSGMTYDATTEILDIDVGGILATKKSISDADELAGSYSGTATIEVVL